MPAKQAMTSPADETPEPPQVPDTLPFALQHGERVLEMRRRHWVFLWPRMILMLVIAVAVHAVLAWLLSEAGALEGTVSTVFTVATGLWILYWGVRMFLNWYQYQYDIWVITNQRLVDSIKRHPFSLQISTADLVNVQDISVHREGILRTVLDYGDIVCQTASERQQFTLAGVPNPRATQALIDRERDRERLRYRA